MTTLPAESCGFFRGKLVDVLSNGCYIDISNPHQRQMKVYNIEPVKIQVSDFNYFAVPLGETGRGRSLVNVAAPETFTYLEVGTTKNGRPRLCKSQSSDGWIARVKTEGAYVRGADGHVAASKQFLEALSVVARGNGAFGIAGRTGSWDDLIVASKVDEFWLRVAPSRGDAKIWLFTANKVTLLTYEEAELLDLDLEGSTPRDAGDLVRL